MAEQARAPVDGAARHEGAGCLLLHPTDESVLFGERNPNHPGNTKARREWEYPGGKAQSAETASQTAIREVREEVGVELDPHQLNQLYECTAPSGMQIVLYAAKLRPEQLAQIRNAFAPDAEFSRVEWLPLSTLRAHLTDATPLPLNLPLRAYNYHTLSFLEARPFV